MKQDLSGVIQKKREERRSIRKVIPQMFDVRPVDPAGNLDLARIEKVSQILRIHLPAGGANGSLTREEVRRGKKVFLDVREASILEEEAKRFRKLIEAERAAKNRNEETRIFFHEQTYIETSRREALRAPKDLKRFDYSESDNQAAADDFSWRDMFFLNKYFGRLNLRRNIFYFSGASLSVLVLILGISFLNKGLVLKDMILIKGSSAYADLEEAKNGMLDKDFQKSTLEFSEAHARFDEISRSLDEFGGVLTEAARFVPYLSKISSGKYLAEAGKDISQIGILSGEVAKTLEGLKNPTREGEAVSFLKLFQDTDENLKKILLLMKDAEDNLGKVNVDDLPEAQRQRFVAVKNQLPAAENFMAAFLGNSQIFTDVLGGNGPRKYLFLFQNNQELRATGGFIGTYGLLDIFNGRVRKFFIDGIFNPDGQLREKVIPPSPIQKISAAWSLHDSNWFPNFPDSAEKAMWFYEKTGGPTVDGVITMTPTVMQKLLEVTGPIEMPEYGVTVDENNFIEKIQYEVEMDYDKELNQPKKILADLAPEILDRIFNARDLAGITKTVNILTESLNEKQILVYSRNYEIEKRLSALGWSGEVLNTQKDYLSVINTNINGYKTDGVVTEKIEHQAEIQADGSVIDTVTITRHHNGGDTAFEWWNKVNADYMRVYVPKGSVLISAEGQTREFNSPPLDYNALGFKSDPQVRMEEGGMQIDEQNGTRVYEDSGKTVFANWVYVSPQETVKVTYKYLLPFKVKINSENNPVAAYSLLAQKQSGSAGSEFSTEISYSKEYKIIWKYPNEISEAEAGKIQMSADLKTDKFIGAAFVKEEKND